MDSQSLNLNTWPMEILDYILFHLPTFLVPPAGKFFSDALCTLIVATALLALVTGRWLSCVVLGMLIGFHWWGPPVAYGEWRELVDWAQPVFWAVILLNFGHFAYDAICLLCRGLTETATIIRQSNDDVERSKALTKMLTEGTITPEEASEILKKKPLYNFRPRKPKKSYN